VGDPVASGITLANGVVFFTTVASGKLVALDADTGKVLKEIELGPVWSGPSVSRGRVYVGTGNTLFSPMDYEVFFPKKYNGVLYYCCPVALAMPKSITLTIGLSSCSVTRILEGFRSRWIIPFWWACWTA
jgi:hypothetical protein